jgi:hypothetical protein
VLALRWPLRGRMAAEAVRISVRALMHALESDYGCPSNGLHLYLLDQVACYYPDNSMLSYL